MNILNKTESVVFLYCRFSLFLKDPFFPVYLEVATAVVNTVWSWYNFSPRIDKVLIFFHNLVFQEYWVLTESRIPIKPMLRGVRIVAISISSHEQTQ